MNWIQRIPFWGWLIFSTLMGYVVYNPTGYSVIGLMSSSVPFSLKILVGILFVALTYFYIHNTWKTLGPIGIGVFGATCAAMLWVANDFGFVSIINAEGMASWWIQIPFGLLVTLGLQGGKLYRAVTGNLITSTGSAPDHSLPNSDVGYHHQ